MPEHSTAAATATNAAVPLAIIMLDDTLDKGLRTTGEYMLQALVDDLIATAATAAPYRDRSAALLPPVLEEINELRLGGRADLAYGLAYLANYCVKSGWHQCTPRSGAAPSPVRNTYGAWFDQAIAAFQRAPFLPVDGWRAELDFLKPAAVRLQLKRGADSIPAAPPVAAEDEYLPLP